MGPRPLFLNLTGLVHLSTCISTDFAGTFSHWVVKKKTVMAGDTKLTALPRWLEAILIGRRPKWTLVRLATIIIAAFVLFGFVLIPIRVTGISMYPTYPDRRINFINRLAYLHHEPQRGDVVGIRLAGEHLMLMKRIIGLPGEIISFSIGVLFINGQPIEEPYIKLKSNWDLPPTQLREHEYYYVGDNRPVSTRGVVARRRIVGRVLLSGDR
jgi:signal peptidase I